MHISHFAKISSTTYTLSRREERKLHSCCSKGKSAWFPRAFRLWEMLPRPHLQAAHHRIRGLCWFWLFAVHDWNAGADRWHYSGKPSNLCYFICDREYHRTCCHRLSGGTCITVHKDVGRNSPILHIILLDYVDRCICGGDYETTCSFDLFPVIYSNFGRCLVRAVLYPFR